MTTKPKAKTSTALTTAKNTLPANVQEKFANEVAALQKRIAAPSGDRISVTQAKTFRLPNGLEVDELECVVVDFVAANYYYATEFDKNAIVPPDCFALGLEPAGLVPSDNSPDKQCDSCAACWANQFGTARNKRGKACANTRLLAVLPLDATEDTPLQIIKVSSTGLKSFDGHVGSVATKFGVPIRGVKTRISMSDDDYASLRFNAMGLVDPRSELFALVNNVQDVALQRLLTEPDVTARAEKPVAVRRAPAKKAAAARR